MRVMVVVVAMAGIVMAVVRTGGVIAQTPAVGDGVDVYVMCFVCGGGEEGQKEEPKGRRIVPRGNKKFGWMSQRPDSNRIRVGIILTKSNSKKKFGGNCFLNPGFYGRRLAPRGRFSRVKSNLFLQRIVFCHFKSKPPRVSNQNEKK